jgi:hypothetical protein
MAPYKAQAMNQFRKVVELGDPQLEKSDAGNGSVEL